MTMRPLLGAALLAGLVALPAAAQPADGARPGPPPAEALAAPGRPGWMVDGLRGCWLWNPAPRAGETASWFGACPAGPAEGPGSAEFRVAAEGQATRYIGVMRDGRPDGMGQARNAAGDGYAGEWRQGLPHGFGIFTAANGDHFEGAWQEGRRAGPGTQVFANGDRFEGGWQEDRPHGYGRAVLGGVAYSGLWAAGCFQDPAGGAAGIAWAGAGACGRTGP